ncbi:MAG TPA: radical SAM protein [Ruminiclostridium sp.]
MRVGLIDVDGYSNFPNLALMKISAYHKQQGDQVEWGIPMLSYDIVYQSKVFDTSPDFDTYINADQIIKGGRAYDKKQVLPQEIETLCPDYSLYNIKNEAYGYLTRGCPRGCPFCDVVNIEGNKSYKVADLNQFWKGETSIKLLDPNTLACKDRLELLDQLIDSKAWVDFTQGLDIRFMADEVIEKIKQIRIKMIHFAWDGERDTTLILKNLEHFKKETNIDSRKLRVYVLTNYETEHSFDLERIYKLKELGYDPYVMVFDKDHAPKQTKKLQRWVNNKFIFRVCERFEDYGKVG